MKSSRVLKILKRSVVIVIGMVLGVFFLNTIIYRVNIPEGFKEFNWEGTWKSSGKFYITGKIGTWIPENADNDFVSETYIYYNIWSLYRPGQSKIVKLTGNFSSEDISGHNSELKGVEDGRERTGKFLFKANMVFADGQSIQYDGKKANSGTLIKGIYRSRFPSDKGVFELHKD